MKLDRKTLDQAGNPLFGFGGRRIDAIGKKTITVAFSEDTKVRAEEIAFDIVDIDYPYTAIFGRGIISKFDMVIRQTHLCMKIPSPTGIISVFGNQISARRIDGKPIPGYSMVHEVKSKLKQKEEEDQSNNKEPKALPAEETIRVSLSPNRPDECVNIGASLG
jgi:hypothetical protein